MESSQLVHAVSTAICTVDGTNVCVLRSNSMVLDAAAEADVRARVTFDIELKKVEGNHSSFNRVCFGGVELCRQPEWVGQLAKALGGNTACTVSIADPNAA